MKVKKINLREIKLRKLKLKRLRYRTLLVFLGIAAAVIIGFNFWFIDHAEEALEQIVVTQSKGRMKLKVAKFKFNWIRNKIELQQASIYSTDTTAPVVYSVNTKNIYIKARGFLPLLFKKEILIDSITLTSPQVIFTRYNARVKKQDTVDTLNDSGNFSVAEEMGRISNSINEAINVLQIKSFKLDDGSFSLVDKTKPTEAPFLVNKIHIQIDNIQFDSTRAGKKAQKEIGFTDNIVIRTANQNIAFPGGRHYMSFKGFRFNLQNKRVEFDSCTLRAIKGDSSKTAFKIFFDKLQLTKINFDTLYNSETIIADSVFCSRPKIFFDVDADQRNNKKAKNKVESIDDVMQQLLGDMNLNYVGIKNADLNINTIKNGKTSTIAAIDNNFELYKLVVKQNATPPVSVDKFVMTLHSNETVLQDGRYTIAFDSIGFEDDIINLNKFSFKEVKNGHVVKSLNMPTFQLRGLSWEALLYDNTFNAQSAVFFNPTIDYTADNNRTKKSKNIFETLNSVGDIMNLTNLGVQSGNITLRFGKGASLQLQNTNLSVLADELTSSQKIKSVQRSIRVLKFDKGIFKKGDMTALLSNVQLAENKSGIKASALNLQSNGLKATANNIGIGSVILDSANQNISINNVRWASANINMHNSASAKNKKTVKTNGGKKTPLVLRDIYGTNTTLNIQQKNNKISGVFNTISLAQYISNAQGKPEIKGLALDGKNFLMLGPETKLSIDKLDINDKNNSVISNIQFSKFNHVDSILAVIPQLTIIPNITEIVNGNLTLNALVLKDPLITARLGRKDSAAKAAKKNTPGISLGSALLQRPTVKLTLINKNDSASQLMWDGVKYNSYIQLRNFSSNADAPIKADQIKVFLTQFNFINTKGKRIATNDNKLNLEFNDVLVSKNEKEKVEWRTNVDILSMDHLAFDSLGKKNAMLKLDRGDIKNIALNSTYIKNMGDVIANSKNLDIKDAYGNFKTGKNQLYWYNFGVTNGFFGVDSLNFSPLQTAQEYRIAKAFNEDYLKLHTGKILAGPVDLEKYGKDSILSMGNIKINDINLFTFKDKTQPDTVIKYKPLPAELLLKLKSPLDIDSLQIKNMNVEYWEINPQTDSLGIIPISNMNVLIRNIKNYNINDGDSIYISANADVLNRLNTNINIHQSYKDSSGGLVMKISTGPMQLTAFNSLLVPMVGIEILGGNLKGLHMHAVGNNEASLGSMRMYYDGLKLRLLNKKDLPNQRFIDKVISWAANTIILKKNNKGKESLVFFERLQQKSAINFIIKTTVEGLKSSVGVPGAKRKLKKYKKRQKEKNA